MLSRYLDWKRETFALVNSWSYLLFKGILRFIGRFFFFNKSSWNDSWRKFKDILEATVCKLIDKQVGSIWEWGSKGHCWRDKYINIFLIPFLIEKFFELIKLFVNVEELLFARFSMIHFHEFFYNILGVPLLKREIDFTEEMEIIELVCLLTWGMSLHSLE